MLHATLIQLEDMLTRLASVSALHAKEQRINLHLCIFTPDREEGDTVTMATSLPSSVRCLQQGPKLHIDLFPPFPKNTMTNKKAKGLAALESSHHQVAPS